MAKLFMGIDIGTSESKGVLCTTAGTIVATAVQAHGLITPKPGYAEHDPEGTWWQDVCILSRKLLSTPGIRPQDILCVGCSAISCAVTAVGEDGLALRNAILYGIDTRAEEEIALLNEAIGEDVIFKRCGEVLSMDSYGPKVYWIRRHEPALYEKTAFFTFAQGYINYKLTGENYIDHYSVFFSTPLYNYQTRDWDPVTAPAVTSLDRLPKIAHPFEIIGTVTQQASGQTGLAPGTPVICGTTDAGAEALSIGVCEPGDTMVMYGSTIYINTLTAGLHVKNNPLWKGYYHFENIGCIMAGMSTTGLLTRWLRDEFAKELVWAQNGGGANAYEALFSTVKDIPAGAEGVCVLPYFLGERMPLKDPLARGMIFGLTLNHTRGHVVRAALEGIGYGLDQNLCIIEAMQPIGEITAVGGGTKSAQWMQIMSDITGYVQRIPKITIGASFGDAMLCALGTGLIERDDIRAWNSAAHKIYPDPAHKRVYAAGKALFSELYKANKELMHALSMPV